MTTVPLSLLQSLEGLKGFQREAFEQVHADGKDLSSVRYNPLKWPLETLPDLYPENVTEPVVQTAIPWSSRGYYVSPRPSFTLDPLFHAGAYYVQEASSMFLEQALAQHASLDQPLRALDLCAAPGGKSTLLQSLLSPESVLVSNEVIKSRSSILEENLTKWGALNTIVTNNDPRDIARLQDFFDLIVVDAPCSGSGLFRRDPTAIEEWSESAVTLCSQRQQRILSDILPALKEDGLLIYSTCSYSKQEDEDILDWLVAEHGLESLSIKLDASWGIEEVVSTEQQSYGYRFWPHLLKGEGFFIACFRKKNASGSSIRTPKNARLEKATKAEVAAVQHWLQPDAGGAFMKLGEALNYIPEGMERDLMYISSCNLYLRKAGVLIGKWTGRELLPDHALSMSSLVSEDHVAISLNREQALQYLRREEVILDPMPELSKHPFKGWSLVRYGGLPLGWIKLLSNRINNYYPKEWRILKKAGS